MTCQAGRLAWVNDQVFLQGKGTIPARGAATAQHPK